LLHRTRVKICGITQVADALHAVAAGADALGFVFYPPSPRYVSMQQAADIIAQLPPFVTCVGLLVDPTAAQVQQLLEQVPLSLLQFHGDESPDFCGRFGVPYLKAIRVKAGTDLPAACQRYAQATGLLLDTYVEGVPGGTGQTFNWQLIPTNLAKPIVLAGGLNPMNVGDAINTVHPWAVDVSGGVEAAKGCKSATLIDTFMQGVLRVSQ
jgi:phosphoribosylanthranilate isomerase